MLSIFVVEQPLTFVCKCCCVCTGSGAKVKSKIGSKLEKKVLSWLGSHGSGILGVFLCVCVYDDNKSGPLRVKPRKRVVVVK